MLVSPCSLCIDAPIHHQSKATTTKGTARFQASTHSADPTVCSIANNEIEKGHFFIHKHYSLMSYMSRFDAAHYPVENTG